MQEFIDRKKAINGMTMLLSEQTTPWMVLSGNSKIGKTEFAKEIAKMYENTIFCNTQLGEIYAWSFVQSICFKNGSSLENIVYEFARSNDEARNIFNSMGLKYVSSLKKNQLSSVINLIIKNDISSGLFIFAHYLGEKIIFNINCIFLDDFNRCDYDSYTWILEFWKSLIEPLPTVLAICNFQLNWESSKLMDLFHGVFAPITIEKFDSEDAYYDILKEYFHFENDIHLDKIARQLFALYEGDAGLLFETVKLLKGQTSYVGDEEKTKQILKTAQQIHLRQFEEFSKVHMLVLSLLAYSPAPITKNSIIDILDLIEPIASEILNQLYDGNFIYQIAHKETGQTLYGISDDFLDGIIKGGSSTTDKLFYKTKVYRAIEKGQIDSTQEQTLNLAIAIEADEVGDLLVRYINSTSETITEEKKAYYLDKVLNSEYPISEQFVSIDIIQLLYIYGYYNSAEKLMQTYSTIKNNLSFENNLLLGDIQHVLLSPYASQSFKYASEMQGISISDKLKALNRQIMALNQEHQEILAKELYINAFTQYEATPCNGLIELYRNANNSFDYNKAMEYTVKGYFLAKELNEELEMYKCLHNICMIRLQYGLYGQPWENNPLGFEPTFEQILTFFTRSPEYRHEQAYPLLDLGTAKMFEYVSTHEQHFLISAKKYYSEAQLYAKSFYARHIAEMGLLIVNSYQYVNVQPAFIQGLRNIIYNRYLQQKNNMEDYRVHRKILLSLAVSSIITYENQEAALYLKQAKPYIIGAETLRYNNLCQKAGCGMYSKETVPLNGKYEVYYGSDEFVPWLISFGH